MTRVRHWLLLTALGLALLLPLGGSAAAAPGDGGFGDPTIATPVGTVQVSSPGVVRRPGASSTLGVGDGGFGD